MTKPRAVLLSVLSMGLISLGVVVLTGNSEGSADQTGATPFKTHNDLLLEVHHLAPGFGGMFLSDDNAILYAYMLDTSQERVAKQALEEVFGPEITEGREFQVIQGQYSIEQLYDWYERKRDAVWAIPAVHMTEIDEGENRLEVQIDHLEHTSAVESALVDSGVPVDAVVIRTGVKPEPAIGLPQGTPTLTGAASGGNLVGGYKITGYHACTLGFISKHNGKTGFITNGHCTQPFYWNGGVQSQKFYQPSSTVNPTAVGTEISDPPISATLDGCANTYKCRYSDSTFIETSVGTGVSLGVIAKPTGIRSTTVSTNSSFRVVKDSGTASLNQIVHKVGQTTGWTSGKVVQSCADVRRIHADPATHTVVLKVQLLCQDVVKDGPEKIGEGGDSGSPVFQIANAPEGNDVHLLGLLWAVNNGDPEDKYFWYSRIENVYGELTLASGRTWDSCGGSLNC